MVSTDPDIRREEAIAEEALTERVERELERLSAIHVPPWNDAGPESKISSDEERPASLPAAGDTAA